MKFTIQGNTFIFIMEISNIEEKDKNKGVIYQLYCNVSKKSYIGQARNYVNGDKIHGADGRFKTHIHESRQKKTLVALF